MTEDDWTLDFAPKADVMFNSADALPHKYCPYCQRQRMKAAERDHCDDEVCVNAHVDYVAKSAEWAEMWRDDV